MKVNNNNELYASFATGFNDSDEVRNFKVKTLLGFIDFTKPKDSQIFPLQKQKKGEI